MRPKKALFDIDEFAAQMGQITKLGPMSRLIGMIPGKMTQQLGGAALVEKQIVIMRAICGSMTPLERAEPERIGPGQRRRIAAGAGVSTLDVSQLMRQFEITRRIRDECAAMSFPSADRILALGAVTDRAFQRDPSYSLRLRSPSPRWRIAIAVACGLIACITVWLRH